MRKMCKYCPLLIFDYVVYLHQKFNPLTTQTRKHMIGLLEIVTTKKWFADPPLLEGLRLGLQENFSLRLPFEASQKETPYKMMMADDGIMMAQMEDNGDNVGTEENQYGYVAVLPIKGMLTRNGGACSYGSIELRKEIIAQSREPECRGILFHADCPGGSSDVIQDFKYARDIAHQNGKPIVTLVDGKAYSAMQYISALSDATYYVNVQDGFGSIGVMAAFYTITPGEKNKYTNETYHSIFADKSYKKCYAFRKAEEGDDKELKKELNDLCEQFHSDMRLLRPNVTEEHLTGDTFEAWEVEGILNDGQSTFQEVCKMIMEGKIAIKNVQLPLLSQTKNKNKAKNSINQNNNNMFNKETYPKTFAAMGIETLEGVTEEGAFVNEPLFASVESLLAQRENEFAEAKQNAENFMKQVETLKAEKEELASQLSSASEKLQTAQDDLKAKEASIEALNAEKTTISENLASAQTELLSVKQSLSDKEEQIASLTNQPAADPTGNATPSNNGSAMEAPQIVCGIPAYDPQLSAVENHKRLQQYLANLQK